MRPTDFCIFCAFALRDEECVLRVAHLLAGVVAQLVEHHNGIVGVRGSNPLGSTILSTSHRAMKRWR